MVKQFQCSYFEFCLAKRNSGMLNFVVPAGRGVDLNRNWSVDWGKKEKVFAFVYFEVLILL